MHRIFPLLARRALSSLRKCDYEFPEIKAEDLLWKTITGSGPGGQAINNTHNAVQLTHLPTGLVVKDQTCRNLELNKKDALEKMKYKLDRHLNGDDCWQARLEREQNARFQKSKTRSIKRLKKKLEFKESFKAES